MSQVLPEDIIVATALALKAVIAVRLLVEPNRLNVQMSYTPTDPLKPEGEAVLKIDVKLDGKDLSADHTREVTQILRIFGSNAMPSGSA